MTDRDWDFCIGSLGDPLQDIEWWMLPPCEEDSCRTSIATGMPDQNGRIDENQ
uniref:Uncharacterized protein n=1 Tax=viral metagenome TaxID=1070528 RepID=A0A6M3K9L0_9ZZZZ